MNCRSYPLKGSGATANVEEPEITLIPQGCGSNQQLLSTESAAEGDGGSYTLSSNHVTGGEKCPAPGPKTAEMWRFPESCGGKWHGVQFARRNKVAPGDMRFHRRFLYRQERLTAQLGK